MGTVVPTNVSVHPLVLLSVVDHYNRVAKDTNKRVVGVLLGTLFKGEAECTNSFAVPWEEDDKDSDVWYLDHNFMEAMDTMFRKVSSNEKIIGWYSTGPKIRAADIRINELFRRYCKNPVYVIIDVAPKLDNSIPTEAYCGVYQVKDDGSASESTFVHVTSTIEAQEAEEIGVEQLLRDVKDTTVSSLTHNINAKLQALLGLRQRLLEMQTYLENVGGGLLPVNHTIVSSIQEIFNLLPQTRAFNMSSALAVETNDSMLAIYLSTLVRSIIALHDLILNKQENKDAEKKAAADELAKEKEAAQKAADKEKELKDKKEGKDKEKEEDGDKKESKA